MKLELRQAAPEDSAFAFAVTEEAMRSHVVATWGAWDRAAQRRAHAQSYSPSTHWVVLCDDHPMGIVAAELAPSHVQLVKLYLRPAARGRGIGTRLVSSLLRSAGDRCQPLRLRVLAVNQWAQTFYRRHGFRETFRTAERVFMEAPWHRTGDARVISSAARHA